MEQFSELLPVFGFVLSLGLFGYGLKKILIKVENDIWRVKKLKYKNIYLKKMSYKLFFIFLSKSKKKLYKSLSKFLHH